TRSTDCAVTVTLTFFVFFQAEDGIRDDLVTGVQTCALPICGGPGSRAKLPSSFRRKTSRVLSPDRSGPPPSCLLLDTSSSMTWRSEERRVGKEYKYWFVA